MMAVATEDSLDSKLSGGWDVAVEWLRALPPEHVLETKDLDKWLEQNQNELSQELKVTPRSEIFARLEAELLSLKMERQVHFPPAYFSFFLFAFIPARPLASPLLGCLSWSVL